MWTYIDSVWLFILRYSVSGSLLVAQLARDVCEFVWILHVAKKNVIPLLLKLHWLHIIWWQLCSIGLVAGLFMCLRSATKITHKAQAITSHAAKWHMCVTINSFDTADCETPVQITSGPQFFAMDTDSSEEAMDGDDVDDTAFIPTHANTISFQKRAALGYSPIPSVSLP